MDAFELSDFWRCPACDKSNEISLDDLDDHGISPAEGDSFLCNYCGTRVYLEFEIEFRVTSVIGADEADAEAALQKARAGVDFCSFSGSSRDAFYEGLWRAIEGAPIDACPYPARPETILLASAWKVGWHMGRPLLNPEKGGETIGKT